MIRPEDFSPLIVELDKFFDSEEISSASLDEALKFLVALSDLKKSMELVYDSFAAKMMSRMQSENATIVSLENGIEVKCMTGSPRKK